jgi:hypothetical protein
LPSFSSSIYNFASYAFRNAGALFSVVVIVVGCGGCGAEKIHTKRPMYFTALHAGFSDEDI